MNHVQPTGILQGPVVQKPVNANLGLNLLNLGLNFNPRLLCVVHKALYGHIDLDVHSFVSFVNNGRTRLSRNPSLTLKIPFCKSKTFQSSYFNRLVKLWNHVCKILPSTTFASLSIFKRSLKATYANLVTATFNNNNNNNFI